MPSGCVKCDQGNWLLRFTFTKGIAGGTLLYVVMFEVLNRERTKNVSGLLQLAGIIVGFASMLMIEIFGELFSLKSDYR